MKILKTLPEHSISPSMSTRFQITSGAGTAGIFASGATGFGASHLCFPHPKHSKTVKKGQVKKWEAGLILDHLDWILLKYVWTLAFSCLCLCWRRDWGALWHFLCYLQVLTVRRTRRGRFTSNFRKASSIHINILAVSCVWIANSFLWNGQLNNPKVSKAVAKFSSKTITEHHSRQVDPA